MNKNLDYNFDIDDFTIRSNRISKTISSDEGVPIIRVNVWYPMSSEKTFKGGRELFDTFFIELSNEFVEFVENKMCQRVKAVDKVNHPYSAVMKFVPTFEDENIVSLIVDTFIYNENGKSKTKRLAFTFNKTNGNIFVLDDLYKDVDDFLLIYHSLFKDKSVERKTRKAYENSNFYFVPNGLILFYDNNNEIETVFFEKNFI